MAYLVALELLIWAQGNISNRLNFPRARSLQQPFKALDKRRI